MNKTYTLKELADIGLKAATAYFLDNDKEARTVADIWKKDEFARQSFTKAILDAIGYDFPKNEDREAFEDWLKYNPCWDKRDEDVAFLAWKAGREELRRKEYLDKQPSEPAWIPWEGGECPLPDGVTFEFKRRDGLASKMINDGCFRWKHLAQPDDILAYRVIEG